MFKNVCQFHSPQLFFSKPNLLDFCHGVDKLWLVTKKFEHFFLQIPSFFPRVFLHWNSRRKYREMFHRRRYWVLPCELLCSIYDKLLKNASLTLLQLIASLFLRQFHRVFELVVKRNFLIRVRCISTVFTSQLKFQTRSGIKNCTTFFSGSDNLFCGKFSRKFSYSAETGQPGAWVGLGHFRARASWSRWIRRIVFELLGSLAKRSKVWTIHWFLVKN